MKRERKKETKSREHSRRLSRREGSCQTIEQQHSAYTQCEVGKLELRVEWAESTAKATTTATRRR